MIILYESSGELQYINIFNHKYIEINDKYYKISGTPKLSELYDMIVTD